MSAYSDLILAHASLRVYYRMDDLALVLNDVGPNNLDGSYAVTGVTYSASGAIANDSNTAVTFAGTSDAATVADNNALDLGDVFSIEFWVKRSATQSATQGLVSKGTDAYLTRFNPTTNRIDLTKGGGATVASSSVITDQNWHHVVVTKNGSATKFYVDGADVTVAGTPATLADNTASLRIGHASAGSNRFPGSMDEIALYGGAALTAAEVLNHYEMGLGIRRLAGSSIGTASVAGELVIGRPLVGASAGQGTASADVTVSHPLEGSSAGTGSATGDLTFLHALVGSSTGASTVSGDVTISRPLAGTSAGAGTATGDLTGNWLLSGTSTGVGIASGALTVITPSWLQDTETSWPALAGTNWPQDTDNEWS